MYPDVSRGWRRLRELARAERLGDAALEEELVVVGDGLEDGVDVGVAGEQEPGERGGVGASAVRARGDERVFEVEDEDGVAFGDVEDGVLGVGAVVEVADPGVVGDVAGGLDDAQDAERDLVRA